MEDVKKNELLVTYIPKHKLPGGLVGITHALHYVITRKNILDKYYEVGGNIHMAKPESEKLFEHIAWEGEIRVEINLDPKL